MKKVVLIGGSGFVGQELGITLVQKGYHITLVSRNPSRLKGMMSFPCQWASWNPKTENFPPKLLEDCYAIINLAGDSVADGMWTQAKRIRLRESRVDLTEKIVSAINLSSSKPEVFINASAIGYYGHRGEEALTESSPLGQGFLAELCEAWEQSSQALEGSSVRRVLIRIGVVLGLGGGVLDKLLPLYAGGLGANLGLGKQWFSWIHIKDLAALFANALQDDQFQGAFNATAPNPVRFSEFHRSLSQKVKVASPMIVPSIFLKLLLGDKSAIVLDSQKVFPERAKAQGFGFAFSQLSDALEDLLGPVEEAGLNVFFRRQWVEKSLDETWQFFTNVDNLSRLTPPEMKFKTKQRSKDNFEKGLEIDHSLSVHGIPLNWRSLITELKQKEYFIDQQLKGPYGYWRHKHLFERLANGTLVTDLVKYKLPLYRVSAPIAGKFVESDIKKIFSYRQQQLPKMLDKAQS